MKHRSQPAQWHGLKQTWTYTDMVEKEPWKSQEAWALLHALCDLQFLQLKIEITGIAMWIKHADVQAKHAENLKTSGNYIISLSALP